MPVHDPIAIPHLSAKQIENFWSHVDKRGPDECWPWVGHIDLRGYGRFWVKHGDVRRVVLTHRVSCFLSTGDVTGITVCHECDNRPCCNPAHLKRGTQQENMADMTARKRRVIARGKNHPRAKLTEDDVRAIRKAAAEGARPIDLSKIYGIADQAICFIISRKRWASVE